MVIGPEARGRCWSDSRNPGARRIWFIFTRRVANPPIARRGSEAWTAIRSAPNHAVRSCSFNRSYLSLRCGRLACSRVESGCGTTSVKFNAYCA